MVGWNDILRFLLELGALAALAYWGLATGDGATAWLLGLGAPLAAAVFWGLAVSPKARVRTGLTGRVVLGLPSSASRRLPWRTQDRPSRPSSSPRWRC